SPQFSSARFESDAVDEALAALLNADRPVLLAGRGAVRSGAGPAIRQLASIVAAPVTTSLLAKGLFDGFDLNLGICGTVATTGALDYIGKADCIVAFGAGLNRYTTVRGDLLRRKKVVQIDHDPARF